MKTIKIGTDKILKKDVKKLVFSPDEIPSTQLFNSDDVIIGNHSSPLAICFVYTWPSDHPPENIKRFAQKISNYAAITGFWRTTNGGKYAFSNILSNPNINKLLILVFNAKDNAHLLAETLSNLWQNGVNEKGIIIGSRAPNPKFEQVPNEALEHLKKQVDLLVLKKLKETDFEMIEKVVSACIQEPENAVKVSDFEGLEYYSTLIKENLIYDDGIRFETPYILDLYSSAKKMSYDEKSLVSNVSQSIQAENLKDASERVASYVFMNGVMFKDERGILNVESRSFTLTVMNPLEVIPPHFDENYIKKYVDEFMNGSGENIEEPAHICHDRIFRRWGNQVEKAISLLKKMPNTRRCLISLLDQTSDMENATAPCLDFIWFIIRQDSLELHATYRNNHLATVNKDGKLIDGEGALVPNLYALGTLQKFVAEKTGKKTGLLILNDFLGHLFVSGV